MKHTKTAITPAPSTCKVYQGEASYWTLNRSGGVTEETANRYKVSGNMHPFPHTGLCSFGFDTPQELMKHLRTLGWKQSSFTNTTNQFARVQVTPTGLNVESFASYSAALEADKIQHSETVLTACPFCHRSDQLDIINWSNERADGSEYIGEAVRCNRCDAIAPLNLWQRRSNGSGGQPAVG